MAIKRLTFVHQKKLYIMKNKETIKKDFDAVKFMRETRDKISLEIQHMNFEELRKYYAERRLKFTK